MVFTQVIRCRLGGCSFSFVRTPPTFFLLILQGEHGGKGVALCMYNGTKVLLSIFWVMQKVVTEDGTARGLLLSPTLEQVRCVLFNSDS